MREQEGAGTDGEKGTFFAGVGLLQVGEGFGEEDRLGLGGKNGVDVGATGDDEDVVVAQVGVGVFVINVGFDSEAGGRGYGLGRGGDSAVEGFGFLKDMLAYGIPLEDLLDLIRRPV